VYERALTEIGNLSGLGVGVGPLGTLQMLIPLVQFGLACAVLSVSCAVTCGADNAFDVVLNSLAFTFISEIPTLFNDVVLK
jgi:hypothetical protein